jgi:hypothetical protein
MRRLAAIALAACLAPSAAMACSCIRLAPEGFRQQAKAIIVGRVTSVTRAAEPQGMVTARIAVTRRIKGRMPRVVSVETRGSSAACGYSFAVGQQREFLLSQNEGRFGTNSCLMLGARR